MNKYMLSIAATAVLAAGALSAQEVRVYNWSDYIDEDLLTKFEEETGIDLIYDVFDSNEVLETKMLAGGSGYDVVVPSGTFLQRQITAGAFQPLDFEQLPNAGNLWDVIQARTDQYDPGNLYAINYMWGTTGIGVNVGKVTEVLGEDAPMDSLALIFDPANMEKLAGCGVQPYVTKFHSSEYINALANGDICVAFGWSGDILQARDRAAEAENGVDIAYNAPTEGALMWFDMMAIPADAPNPEGAHKFLNFIMDAQNMAAASNYVYYANGNLASQEFLVEDVIDDTAIYPDAATLENLYTTRPYDARVQRVVTRMWTRIKSGT